MANFSMTSTLPSFARRLLDAVRLRYYRMRLNSALADLVSYERELLQRRAQMNVHSKRCEAWRVKIAQLGGL